jgi:phosphohistidine phosphatase
MLIGHNPAVQLLVLRLTGATGPEGAGADGGSNLSEVQSKFPTGALATLEFKGAWDKLGPGKAQLVEFVRPKELARTKKRKS